MSNTTDISQYSIFKAKDARFDGRIFVGVSSTGIYCRPICRAKLPKQQNCTYYNTAAAAERAGFRPCLLCRPELAPGTAPVDAMPSLARRAARMLEEQCGSEEKLGELAASLGCTDRHLRRAFAAEYHVSPGQYLQTCRLLLAKNLLTDTTLAIIDVAMAAGFGSVRRFNDAFKKRYRLTPTGLRRQTARGNQSDETITLALGYRPPYLWEHIRAFLALRAIPGIEAVHDGAYMRTVRLTTPDGGEASGWIRVAHKPENAVLTVTLASRLLPVLPQALGRVRHLFDLACNPDVVYESLASMNDLQPGLCSHGLRVPGCFDPFEMVVRAVLGQQITVKAAQTLAARLVETFGTPVETGVDGLTHVFPTPQEILGLSGSIADHLGPLGITGARARTIQALASTLAKEEAVFMHCHDPEAEVKKLLELPGIGAWTAHYIAMRALGWTDAFLPTDYGVKKALKPYSEKSEKSEKEISVLAEAWRPWRSYATVNLWNSL